MYLVSLLEFRIVPDLTLALFDCIPYKTIINTVMFLKTKYNIMLKNYFPLRIVIVAETLSHA